MGSRGLTCKKGRHLYHNCLSRRLVSRELSLSIFSKIRDFLGCLGWTGGKTYIHPKRGRERCHGEWMCGLSAIDGLSEQGSSSEGVQVD